MKIILMEDKKLCSILLFQFELITDSQWKVFIYKN
jgi:hypothetical protein